MAKALWGLLAGFAAAIVAARLAFEFTTPAVSGPSNEPWALSRMEFVAWNNERWTAWVREETFEQIPENTGRWHRHSNPSLAYIDWDGEPWQAKIEGESFILAHRGDWNAPTETASAIRYRDWSGRNQLRTLVQLSR